ncbi:P-loop containing nucleoside triphosphate hydrolase protein [Fimicolochytrium jonesii]|uniref:P-loop containing nucleoside triphosphate hydrolase protein n=1 Tax=Fimicolochytrium jonesii TaxID=1396493 RepID=UPI0022FF28C6|nr:P-loop containing nucleoside triphosphate hydrolase protein [Fimicolochytrium jonesii]KAI8823778.1 P-loop containing nucleoside triphosphate hydrolase protein [Fimicolochytrium jonesii]
MTTTANIAFANLASTFVNLPQEWANALWDQLQNLRSGSVILSLKWKDKSARQGLNREVFVAWAGGAAAAKRTSYPGQAPQGKENRLEIDALYGKLLGLTEGLPVEVEFCKNIPNGTSVNVEPLSVDDWEILELHAGYLEEQFLNQVRVVWDGQIIPVWVQGGTVIRLRIVDTEPTATCVKLDTDAEVIVAPKQRRKVSFKEPEPETMTPVKHAKKVPGLPLRLLPTDALAPGDAIHTPAAPTIYIGPETAPWASQDGSVLKLSPFRFKGSPKDKSANQTPGDDETPDNNTTTATASKTLYVRCHIRMNIPKGHFWATKAVRDALDLHPFARVKAFPPSSPPLKKFQIILRPIDYGAAALKLRDETAKEETVEAFRRELKRVVGDAGSVVLTHGTVQHLNIPGKANGNTTVLVTLIPTEASTTPDDQVTPLDNYIEIDHTNQHQIPVKVHTTLSMKKAAEKSAPSEPAPRLAGIDELLHSLKYQVKHRLIQRGLRGAVASPAPGNILLHGSPGVGKTSIVKAVVHALGIDPSVLAFSTYINCQDLVPERIPKVKDTLQEAIYKAAFHSPAVVVLDNLDRLIPVEQEGTDASRTTQLSSLFLDLALTATSRLGIVLLCTSLQQSSLHASVMTQHVFGYTVHVRAPSKAQRMQILESTLSNNPAIQRPTAGLDLSSIAGTTEGYSPADLCTLTKRALHEATVRVLHESVRDGVENSSDGKGYGGNGGVEVGKEDYEKAQRGYVPAGLKGVKLEKDTGVEWGDIGGLHATKRTILETLEWPTKYASIFANCSLRLRSGLLLYGFPGCGKTLLASAVAKECGLNFISVKGPELLNKYIGASEQSVRDVFERAAAAKPCVLFLDEFDAIAPRRGNDNTGVTDRVVNQMLTQMDGAEGLDGVYVLAATSRPDIIDPALLRPGRLDKSLLCPMPNYADRLEILQTVSRKLTLAPTVDLPSLARRTEGFSGADLQALVYNAQLEGVHGVIDHVGGDVKGEDETGTKEGEKEGRDGEGQREFVVAERGRVVVLERGEKGAIVAKIEAMEKSAKTSSENNGRSDTDKSTPTHQIIQITPDHLETALSTTRPSISQKEVSRLSGIYEEFLGGRVPGGAVGVRATLM